MSLFARKLRAYRMAEPGGAGRMTQEQLAEKLGVSAEAIGKYERSLSFIRGDYEARLVERLGWSAADVVACREDWDSRRFDRGNSRYRVLDLPEIERRYGGSYANLSRDVNRLIEDMMPGIAVEFGVNDAVWVPILRRFPTHGVLITKDDVLVAHWSIQFLDRADRDRFRNRELMEEDLAAERLLRPVLPGAYYGYCPLVAIARGHEAVAPLMLGTVQAFLEELAARGVVLEALGAAGVTAEGRQLCRQLGFARLGDHRVVPDCDVWELPGAAIPGSLLCRRRRELSAVYQATAGVGGDA